MVTTNPDEAKAAVEAGERVVLVVAAPAPGVRAQPGRLAVLVGDPDDPEVRAAALEMDRELHAR